ncbi:MAG: response regulator transcription factor, partial [Chthoniobacterales bacterium]|nr:response regulator transcription factor [Chthoniobacterales bacterium]
ALEIARHNLPTVIVLDLMLPGLSGEEVCKILKNDPSLSKIGILMLTAKSSTEDRIKGLEIGADDYLPKPFSTKELTLRVKSLVRRIKAAALSEPLEAPPFLVNKDSLEVYMDGKKLDLTITEYKLLCLLIENRGKTISREELLTNVWGYQNVIDTRTVDTHISRLRDKISPHSKRILTVRGEGYKFTALPDES